MSLAATVDSTKGSCDKDEVEEEEEHLPPWTSSMDHELNALTREEEEEDDNAKEEDDANRHSQTSDPLPHHSIPPPPPSSFPPPLRDDSNTSLNLYQLENTLNQHPSSTAQVLCLGGVSGRKDETPGNVCVGGMDDGGRGARVREGVGRGGMKEREEEEGVGRGGMKDREEDGETGEGGAGRKGAGKDELRMMEGDGNRQGGMMSQEEREGWINLLDCRLCEYRAAASRWQQVGNVRMALELASVIQPFKRILEALRCHQQQQQQQQLMHNKQAAVEEEAEMLIMLRAMPPRMSNEVLMGSSFHNRQLQFQSLLRELDKAIVQCGRFIALEKGSTKKTIKQDNSLSQWVEKLDRWKAWVTAVSNDDEQPLPLVETVAIKACYEHRYEDIPNGTIRLYYRAVYPIPTNNHPTTQPLTSPHPITTHPLPPNQPVAHLANGPSSSASSCSSASSTCSSSDSFSSSSSSSASSASCFSSSSSSYSSSSLSRWSGPVRLSMGCVGKGDEARRLSLLDSLIPSGSQIRFIFDFGCGTTVEARWEQAGPFPGAAEVLSPEGREQIPFNLFVDFDVSKVSPPNLLRYVNRCRVSAIILRKRTFHHLRGYKDIAKSYRTLKIDGLLSRSEVLGLIPIHSKSTSTTTGDGDDTTSSSFSRASLVTSTTTKPPRSSLGFGLELSVRVRHPLKTPDMRPVPFSSPSLIEPLPSSLRGAGGGEGSSGGGRSGGEGKEGGLLGGGRDRVVEGDDRKEGRLLPLPSERTTGEARTVEAREKNGGVQKGGGNRQDNITIETQSSNTDSGGGLLCNQSGREGVSSQGNNNLLLDRAIRDPFDPQFIVSVEVLEDIRDNDRLPGVMPDKDEADVVDRKELLHDKHQDICEQIQGGLMPYEAYVDSVKKQIVFDKQLVMRLKESRRTAEALGVLRRIKIMGASLTE
eukprot:GHVQ01021866.1.p1 GENE.GHVQ01021866.1~~GHVQ01021866.1.p1  ORF type:complete len:927 (-),score=265.81 GHVQ01021866.1:290-3070(-)